MSNEIPPTSLDVLRGRVVAGRRINRGSLSRGARRVSQQPTVGEGDWERIVAQSVFKRPSAQEMARPELLRLRDEPIKWGVEVISDFNGKGDLGLFLEVDGIEFTDEPFLKSSRDYGPDSAVFYTKIGYKKNRAHLILATRGDIFESQVVPAQIDVNPFSRHELYLPQLTTIYDPTSMAAHEKNRLVVVGFKPYTL